jgi:hypothetical protein
MMAHSKKIGGCIFSLVVAVLFSTMMHAYVLQGPHIIELMTEKLGQAESLFVSQKVIFYNLQPQRESLSENEREGFDLDLLDDSHSDQAQPSQTDAPVVQPLTIQLDESLRYVFSEAFRSDIVSDDNQRIYVFRQGQTLTVIDGVISGVGETRFDLYKDLLLYRSREALSERLSDLGVDISVSSLGKFEGLPAFVVGAEYPDETVAQVWIDKDTFQPLRMIIPSANSSYRADFLDIRYSAWQNIGKIWYPMRIEFVQDGTAVRAIEVYDYQVNPNFSKDVFNIARLRLEYRQPLASPPRSSQTEGLSEVQKTIEEFKKIFE